jgi:hypothetical protein
VQFKFEQRSFRLARLLVLSIGILISTVALARWEQCSLEIRNRLKVFLIICLATGHRAKATVLIRGVDSNCISTACVLRPRQNNPSSGKLCFTGSTHLHWLAVRRVGRKMEQAYAVRRKPAQSLAGTLSRVAGRTTRSETRSFRRNGNSQNNHA